jgi:esterase/lipase
MNCARALVLLVMGFGVAALPVGAQRLNVDPAHPYSPAEQKQSEKSYQNSLKQQQKAQKKNQKARQKAYNKQQKQMKKDNAARQQQIDRANHH